MNYKKDGTPVSSTALNAGLGEYNKLLGNEITKLRKLIKSAVGIHIATIREIHYVDSPKNASKKYVEYKVRIESGERMGMEYPNVVAINLYGGVNNFSEEVLKPLEKSLDNKPVSNSAIKSEHDASEVLVIFLDNSFNRPIIIGANPNSTQNFPGTKEAEGMRSVKEYNGIRQLITKDGEYYMIYFGGPRDSQSKKSARPETAPTIFKIAQDGSWSIEDKENQKIKIDKTNKKIILEQRAGVKAEEAYPTLGDYKDGELINSLEMDKDKKSITTKAGLDTVVETIDGVNEVVTKKFKSGMVITEDGKNKKLTIDVGSTKVEIDANSNNIKLTAGSAVINIDGGSGKISLTGNLVDVGTAASAAAVLGPQLLAYLKSHTHKYSPGPGFPVETAPPTVPPPTSLLSKSVKIKD